MILVWPPKDLYELRWTKDDLWWTNTERHNDRKTKIRKENKNNSELLLLRSEKMGGVGGGGGENLSNYSEY